MLSIVTIMAWTMTYASQAHAAASPLSINLLPPAQFPPDDFAVTGARISLLWGHQRSMYGADIGLIGNMTDQRFVGSAVSGIFNITHGYTNVVGIQVAGIFNYNSEKTTVAGAQISVGANVDTAESSIYGVQFAGLANYAPHTKVHGLQLGIYNDAQEVYGFQIGLFNHAEDLHGVQIGLLNFNDKGMFSVSPILNVGF